MTTKVELSQYELCLVEALKFDAKNARKHDAKNLKAIKGSLKEFGQQKPIVVTEDGTVVAGNGTLEAAKALGWKQVQVVRTRLSGDKVKAYALADNRSAELASWNDEQLQETLKELDSVGFDLESIGFDFTADETAPGAGAEDDIPEDVETRCKPGDLWILGKHRLLCGDSTNVQHVERLMGGEKADMVFTDPPYGMNLDCDFSDMPAAKGTTSKKYDNVIGDGSDFHPDLINTVFACFQDAREIFLWGADYYADLLPNRNDGSWIVWDKRSEGGMDKLFGSSFELCWSRAKHKRDLARIVWAGYFGMGADDTQKRVHPTQKPAKLAEWFFERWGKDNDLVADLFLGSGSTLIACEKTNRKCFGMEIDPKYCDVILSRWETYSGKTAQRVEDGQP